MLIAARFVQGLGAALSASVILAMIVAEFPDQRERTKAMSAYVLVSVGGGSLGLLLGGVLTQALSLALDLLHQPAHRRGHCHRRGAAPR
jgi:MFS family permease